MKVMGKKKEAEIDTNDNADVFRDLSSLRQRRNSTLSSGKPGGASDVKSNTMRRASVNSSSSSKKSITRLDRKDIKGGKDGMKGKSSLLDPVTPSGMADWFVSAGHGVVQYLGKQLMDNDDSNKDLPQSPTDTHMNRNKNGNTNINQSNNGNKISDGHNNSFQGLVINGTNKTSSTNGAASYQRMEGVGRIHVNLVSAFKSLVTDAAEGDHYVVRAIICINI